MNLAQLRDLHAACAGFAHIHLCHIGDGGFALALFGVVGPLLQPVVAQVKRFEELGGDCEGLLEAVETFISEVGDLEAAQVRRRKLTAC